MYIFVSGWTGPVCDLETNECMSEPCQNGAVCIDLHADYLCACPFGNFSVHQIFDIKLNVLFVIFLEVTLGAIVKMSFTSVIRILAKTEPYVYWSKVNLSATVFQIFTENSVNFNMTSVSWENGTKILIL